MSEGPKKEPDITPLSIEDSGGKPEKDECEQKEDDLLKEIDHGNQENEEEEEEGEGENCGGEEEKGEKGKEGGKKKVKKEENKKVEEKKRKEEKVKEKKKWGEEGEGGEVGGEEQEGKGGEDGGGEEEGGGEGGGEDGKRVEEDGGGGGEGEVTTRLSSLTLNDRDKHEKQKQENQRKKNEEEKLQNDIDKYFCHCAQYGISGDWPRETILYYKLEYDDAVDASKSLPAQSPTLHRIENEPNKHAEVKLVEELRRVLDRNCQVKLVDIYLSYSPCKKCADELVSFLQTTALQMSIKSANFYYHYVEPNVIGLCLLINSGVNLSVFLGETDWVQFYDDVTGKEPEYRDNYTAIKRQEREKVDETILKRLEMIAPYLEGTDMIPQKVKDLFSRLFPRRFTEIESLTNETEDCRKELEAQ